MGMFDSVIAVCPKCGAQVEFQSKEGDCFLREYSACDVPIAIAKDVACDRVICKCGSEVTLRIPEPDRVNMTVHVFTPKVKTDSSGEA